MTTPIDTLVLAGGKSTLELRMQTGATLRALAPLAGRPMFSYVTDALAACESVGRVFVVGDVPAGDGYTIVPPADSLLGNVMRGLDAAQSFSLQHPTGKVAPILLATSDIPLLTPAAVQDFLAQAVPLGADFAYAVVPLPVCTARFPTLKRTTLKLKEGQFTGGNLMLVNPAFLREHQQSIAAAYAARKQPLRLARMLGAGLLARVLLSQMVNPRLLSIPQLEAGVERLLGGTARAVVSNYAEVGTDCDSPADFAVAERELRGP